MRNEFSQLYQATIGVDILSKQIKIEDKQVQLTFWDTAGSEKTNSFTTNFFRETEGCILVFDLTDKSSFEIIDFWRKEFLNHLKPSDENNYPFILKHICDRNHGNPDKFRNNEQEHSSENN